MHDASQGHITQGHTTQGHGSYAIASGCTYLCGRVQQTGRGSFAFWVSDLGCELESYRQVTGHEEPVTWYSVSHVLCCVRAVCGVC